jgi:dihydroorotate dehydrogenase (NAD+) catalytic subunit
VRRALPDACILGAGGIRSGADALAYLAAGADAVQVGSAILSDPTAPTRVTAELEQELTLRGLDRPADIAGIAHAGGLG